MSIAFLALLSSSAHRGTLLSNGTTRSLPTRQMDIGPWRPLIPQVSEVLQRKPGSIDLTTIPAYYLPPSSLTSATSITQIPNKSSLCEWKGRATYWTLKTTDTSEEIHGKIWSYESPTQPFKDIKGYLSFYASGVPWECFVDDERVAPQPGDFYGGWSTSELEGVQKGGPGTWGW